MKLLTPSNSYPESYWFSYDHEHSLDHLRFYECRIIPASEAAPKMILKSKVSIGAIRQYDYLFSDGPDFISARLAGIISSSALADDVQLIRIDAEINGESYDDYFIINYLKCESAIDMVKSIYKPLIRSMPKGPKKFNRIVLLDRVPVGNIFRALESNSHVVSSDEVSEIFKINSVKGVEFVSGKDGL